MPGVQVAEAGRMDGERPPERIDRAEIGCNAGPAPYLLTVVEREPRRQVVWQVRLARHAPEYRVRAVPCDKISPVFLQPLRADPWQVISPRSDDARRKPVIDKVR